MTDRFNGFLPQAPGFFERLAVNNNKAWFEEQRDQYEELLLEPLKPVLAGGVSCLGRLRCRRHSVQPGW